MNDHYPYPDFTHHNLFTTLFTTLFTRGEQVFHTTAGVEPLPCARKKGCLDSGRPCLPTVFLRGKTDVIQTPQLIKPVSSGLVFTHRGCGIRGPRQPPLRPAFSSFNASLREKHRVPLLLCNRCAQARICGATLRPSNTLPRFADLAIAGVVGLLYETDDMRRATFFPGPFLSHAWEAEAPSALLF